MHVCHCMGVGVVRPRMCTHTLIDGQTEEGWVRLPAQEHTGGLSNCNVHTRPSGGNMMQWYPTS